MSAIVLLLCVPAALAIYFGIVRPFLIPLEWKIPHGAAYRPTSGAWKR